MKPTALLPFLALAACDVHWMARSSGFDELVDPEGFAAVYPWGVRRSWADGRGGSPAEEEGVDDVAFIGDLLDEVEGQIPVDTGRVYVVGISNGGMMTQRLGCELTARFAAAATIIGALPEAVAPGCQPSVALSMLVMNGTEDPLVPYEGGPIQSDNEGVVLSTADTIAHWREADGCTGAPETQDFDAVDDGTAVHVSRWEGCEGGSGVALYEVEGGGHTWPGGPQYASEDRIGRVSQELVAAEAIWAFFEGRSR